MDRDPSDRTSSLGANAPSCLTSIIFDGGEGGLWSELAGCFESEIELVLDALQRQSKSQMSLSDDAIGDGSAQCGNLIRQLVLAHRQSFQICLKCP